MASYELYILPFAKAFFVCVALLSALVAVSGKMDFLRREGARHIHKENISRLGGAALIVSFAAALFWDRNLVFTQQLWGVMLALGAILLVGLWDDFRELHWKTQLFFQVALVTFMFLMGVHVDYIANPLGGIFLLDPERLFLPSFLVAVFWVVMLINSLNWADGVDGLSGGVTLVGALTIFLLSLKPEVNQPPVAIIAAALSGSVLAFLVFNFHPARIFAGTSGAMFMGFILAILAIFAGAKIATALLVTAIPIIDAVWVIFQRLRVKKPIFEADNFHLHHRLLELGWTPRGICAFFYVLTAVIAAIALSAGSLGKIVTVAAVFLLMAAMLFWVRRKAEHLRNKRQSS